LAGVGFSYDRAAADVFVPDGSSLDVALGRTTDLGIVAHQDDLEFLGLVAIGACMDDPERGFTGVTCTDGAGSARSGAYAACTDAEMVELRRVEQRRAAEIGRYGAMVQLGHPSAWIRGDGHDGLVGELAELLAATRPVNVYTHNLADKHPTHVAVAAAVVEAVRRLPSDERPWKVVGVEGWRSLDWLGDDEKVRLDVSDRVELADRLAEVFASQIAGGKRYDLAERGRRQANATLLSSHEVDAATELTFAFDLSALAHNDQIDPVTFVTAAIDRFRSDVTAALREYFPEAR
jgi:LmbE family N-acetylglucosaminyl deacetylase